MPGIVRRSDEVVRELVSVAPFKSRRLRRPHGDDPVPIGASRRLDGVRDWTPWRVKENGNVGTHVPKHIGEVDPCLGAVLEVHPRFADGVIGSAAGC